MLAECPNIQFYVVKLVFPSRTLEQGKAGASPGTAVESSAQKQSHLPKGPQLLKRKDLNYTPKVLYYFHTI